MRDVLTELQCSSESLDYLGDGVYCGIDGIQVWLVAERDGMYHKVALDPRTLGALARYVEKHKLTP